MSDEEELLKWYWFNVKNITVESSYIPLDVVESLSGGSLSSEQISFLLDPFWNIIDSQDWDEDG